MRRRTSALAVHLVALVLGLTSPATESLQFDVSTGGTRCITEDIKSNAMTVGKYSIVNPVGGHKITVRVTSPHGGNYHYSDNVESGTFAFTAAESGDYRACFWISGSNEHREAITLSVELEWKSGVASRDWPKVAKKGQIEEMEVELRKLLNAVESIHDEMFYLREREEEMQSFNKATNSKMAVFSFVSIFVCLSVACTQLWYLKSFFEKKKLI